MPLVPTVRIPELPAQISDLTTADLVAGWDAATNKTRKFSLDQIRSLILTGGPTALVPVVIDGGNIYGRVEAADDGSNTVPRPDLAGKTFDLELDYQFKIPQTDPPNALAEFEVLSGGGFKLLNGDVVHEGQPYKLTIHSSVSGGSGGVTGAASLFSGRKEVNSNILLDIVSGGDDLNKLVQLRSGATQVTLTLPSVLDVPANLPICIESMIGNSVENRITTTGGQFFYFNNTSKTSLYIRPGEVVWLFRYSDGFYVINDFGNNYKGLCTPVPKYKVGLNQVVMKGQEVLRADYPRTWEEVQGLGASLVSEAVWGLTSGLNGAGQTVPFPNRGKWSTGDGSTTFRFPDLMGMALRGLISEAGSDNERYTNDPGNYQKNQIIAHTHTSNPDGLWNESGNGHVASGGNSNEGPTAHQTGSYGGAETRMDNIGILWVTNV